MSNPKTRSEKIAIVQDTYNACLWFSPYVDRVAIYFEEQHREHFEKVHQRLLERMKWYGDNDKTWTAHKTRKELCRAKTAIYPFVVEEVHCFTESRVVNNLFKSLTCGKRSDFNVDALDIVADHYLITRGNDKYLDERGFKELQIAQAATDLFAELSGKDTDQKLVVKKFKI